MRGWVVPIAAGLVAALITIALPTPENSDSEPTPNMVESQLVFPFILGPAMDQPKGEILVLSDGINPTNVSWPAADGTHFDLMANITWHTDKIGTISVTQDTIYCIRAPCPQPAAPWSIRFPADGPRFGPGNETIITTIFVFDLKAELLATNAPAASLGDFTLSAEYIPIGNKPWYLGNQTAPADAQVLPFGTALAKDALAGLPVGGIATVYLETHPYDWYIGPLWLTARIDGFA